MEDDDVKNIEVWSLNIGLQDAGLLTRLEVQTGVWQGPSICWFQIWWFRAFRIGTKMEKEIARVGG